MLHLAIAEDKPRLAAALTADLGLFEDLLLTASYPNGRALVTGLATLPNLPDVILMDIEMPLMDGITATAEIKARHPQIKILMLTVFEDEDNLFRAIQAGADGYLLKGTSPRELHHYIHEVVNEGAPMSPMMARKSLKLLRALPRVPGKGNGEKKSSPATDPLTKRELEVLEQLSAGLKYRAIAGNLHLSEGTVRKHVENIYRKLRVNNKTSAVAKGRDLLN